MVFDLETLSFILQPESLKSAEENTIHTIHLTFYDNDKNRTSFIFSVDEGVRSASTTGILDSGKNINAEILLYPNPASDILYMDFQEEISNTFDLVRILDVSGKMMTQQQLYDNHGPHRIDVNRLPQGVYTLIVTDADSGELRSFKIMISPLR
jgi:hypothetical protein